MRIVVAETRTCSLASSPRIRWYPHLGFSRARRRVSSAVSRCRPGRPAFALFRKVHFRRTSSRCQRSNVSGLTMKDDHSDLGTR